MAAVSERVGLDPEKAWAGTVLAIALALVAGSLAFPRTVYDGFVWHYFWGPVYADAHGAECAVRAGGTTTLLRTGCDTASGVVAYPGYTLVSEVGYALVLILALVGVAFLLARLGVERYRAMFFGLFPFMIFGGALRVVEDANDATFRATGEWIVTYPLNTLLISPIIYVTMFVLALAALVVALRLDRTGVVDGFEYPLAAFGSVGVVATLGFLVFMATATDRLTINPLFFFVVVGLAVTITALAWFGVERFAPEINEGTGYMGIAILYGQAIDGVANVAALDWAGALGLAGSYDAKHPVNALIVSITNGILPQSVTNVIGDTWPFLFVKVAAAVFILWIFDENVMDDSPRYTVMLLLAATAVGVGPGTRDLLRATFGI